MPPATIDAPSEPEPRSRSALAATLLVPVGVVSFAGGAVLTLWPLWALGLVLVAGGFFVYRD